MLQVNASIQYLALEGNEFSTLDLIDFLKSLLCGTLQELRVSTTLYQQEVEDCVITINVIKSKLGVNSKLKVIWMNR